MRDFYQEIIDIIGSGAEACCVIPIGDPAFENAAHTTVTTKGQGALDGLIFTYSEDRRAFDRATIYTRNQFRSPFVPWNGSDEEADTPDIDAWSRNDASSEGMSHGFLANIIATAGTQNIISKDDAGLNSEWQLRIQTDETLLLLLIDESAGVFPNRGSNVAVKLDVVTFLAQTYDGSGGATAADGIALYQDGVILASTASNNASYVAMENLDSVVQLCQIGAVNEFFGYLGTVFFTHRVLSAVEVFNLNDIYVDMQRAQRSRLLAGVL